MHRITELAKALEIRPCGTLTREHNAFPHAGAAAFSVESSFDGIQNVRKPLVFVDAQWGLARRNRRQASSTPAGEEYAITVTAEGDGPIAYTTTDLPDGLSLDGRRTRLK